MDEGNYDDEANTDRPAAVPKVGYIVDRVLLEESARMEKIGKRSIMLHSLLNHTHLTKRLRMFPCRAASEEDLLVFHSREYVQFLSRPEPDLEEELGFGYDCPVLERMDDFVRSLAAGSLTAADLLLEGRVDLAVNWSGGWHHAQRDQAAGFCYVNDIVLAIHRLQRAFKRVMYVDLDVHHGDGVEDAFSCTDKVLTFSVHKMEPGFFPGTGAYTDVGHGRGRYFSVNIPMRPGLNDDRFKYIFNATFSAAVEQFKPDVFVVQCGADGLSGDPLGGFNLTPHGLSSAVQQVVGVGLPVLLLGGGGYNIPNTVRCWVQVTADLLGVQVADDLPDSDPFFLEYGPDYRLALTAGLMKDHNSDQYIENVLEAVKSNIKMMESR